MLCLTPPETGPPAQITLLGAPFPSLGFMEAQIFLY